MEFHLKWLFTFSIKHKSKKCIRVTYSLIIPLRPISYLHFHAQRDYNGQWHDQKTRDLAQRARTFSSAQAWVMKNPWTTNQGAKKSIVLTQESSGGWVVEFRSGLKWELWSVVRTLVVRARITDIGLEPKISSTQKGNSRRDTRRSKNKWVSYSFWDLVRAVRNRDFFSLSRFFFLFLGHPGELGWRELALLEYCSSRPLNNNYARSFRSSITYLTSPIIGIGQEYFILHEQRIPGTEGVSIFDSRVGYTCFFMQKRCV